MKYRENVCQYKNFSSISIVSGSNISHTSSRYQKKREPSGTTREHQDLPLSKGLKGNPQTQCTFSISTPQPLNF